MSTPGSTLPTWRAGPIHLWNPSGFDPVTYIGEPLRKRSDLARFVVHKIVWANAFRRTNDDGYANLKAEYLRKFFPDSQSYRQVMDCLIRSGAIICDGSYVRGHKCLGYKLNPELSAMRQTRVCVADPTLAMKIARDRDKSIEILQPIDRYLLGHLRTVEIDREAALETVHAGGFDPMNETAIQFIAAGDWHLSVCPYGRVHTNLTNLKSELRKHLSVKGERLVNLDIGNSQPLIFAAMLRDRFEFSAGRAEVPADVLRYVELVQAGAFYDQLMGDARIPAEDRSAFKRGFFGRVFFCKNDPPSKQAEAFGDAFPNVYRTIRDLKAEDYKALSHQLQKRESSIMIGGVATRCMAEMPHAFVGTIHDSILCQPGYADEIRRIMLDEFAKAELIPTIRTVSP